MSAQKLPQSVKCGGLQEQVPALHQSLCVPLQTWLQPPQCLGSESGPTHRPSQQMFPDGQPAPASPAGGVQLPETQAPLMQTCEAPQAMPQPPQFALSNCVLTHLFEHSVRPTEAQATQLDPLGPYWQ